MRSRLHRFKKQIFLFFFACQQLLFLFAIDGVLRFEFRTELVAPPKEKWDTVLTGPLPIKPENAARNMLYDAQYAFSGMIYGFNFTYTPWDIKRNVADSFNLTLLALIPWGSKSLQIAETRSDTQFTYAYIEYSLSDFEKSLVASWQSQVYVRSQGTGSCPMGSLSSSESGAFISDEAIKEERKKAIEDAVKNAVKQYAQDLIINKPRLISGSCIFVDNPRIIQKEGSYVATVKIRLFIKEVIPYKVY